MISLGLLNPLRPRHAQYPNCKASQTQKNGKVPCWSCLVIFRTSVRFCKSTFGHTEPGFARLQHVHFLLSLHATLVLPKLSARVADVFMYEGWSRSTVPSVHKLYLRQTCGIPPAHCPQNVVPSTNIGTVFLGLHLLDGTIHVIFHYVGITVV